MRAEVAAGRLVLDRVSRRFGTRAVVDEVSFEAAAGRVTVLVGPSGCGKSTLLRMIAGVEEPSGGRILIDGLEVAGPAALVPPEKRRVGLMFQDYALFPHLSAFDNVLFGLGSLPRTERRRVAEEALARVDLSRHVAARPGRLSGGEQQRLALARALAPAPRILLMDEPFSNLDRGLRDEVRAATLEVLMGARVTAILVTHDPEEALAIGDHLVLLDQGRVIQAGPADDLYRSPSSLAAARALSDVNLVPGVIQDGVLRTPLGDLPLSGLQAWGSREGLAAFRPEQLTVGPPGTGLSGRIEGRTFRGASTLLSVAIPGLDGALRIVVPTDRAPPERQDVGVSAASGMVFPVDGGGVSASRARIEQEAF